MTDGTSPALQGVALGLSKALPTSGFVLKLDPTGSKSVFSALLPTSLVNAIALDQEGNIYTGGLNEAGLTVSKIDSSGGSLLYHSSIAAPLPQMPAAGIAVDSSGSAYLTASVNSVALPDTVQSGRFLPNAALLKVVPGPGTVDLAVEAHPVGPHFPGELKRVVFTVRNNGPADAEGVVLSLSLGQSAPVIDCRVSGSGTCAVAANPWATFPVIVAGSSETVELDVRGWISDVMLNAAAYTLASDVNQSNNFAIATSPAAYVMLTVHSTLNAQCAITGSVSGLCVGTNYAAPNTPVQIYWPSPQQAGGITLTFQGWSDGSKDNPRTVIPTASSTVLAPIFSPGIDHPYVGTAGVTSSASYAAGGVAPGELVTLFGLNLAQQAHGSPQAGRFPASLGNATVTFDNFPAALIYTDSGQINAIVPYEIAGQSTTNMKVQYLANSYSLTLPVISAVPGLFTATGTGQNQAAALNQDLGVNSPSNPANPGDVIVLYGTGAGLVDSPPADGAIVSGPTARPKLPVAVTIGGVAARVLYAGDAPGLVTGVIQINAEIPKGIVPGHHVPVTWSAEHIKARAG